MGRPHQVLSHRSPLEGGGRRLQILSLLTISLSALFYYYWYHYYYYYCQCELEAAGPRASRSPL